MRTWDRLSATFVKGLRTPGKFYDGGGLMLHAAPTKAKGVITKAWLFRYQLDHRERAMGLGSARTVTLAEALKAEGSVKRVSHLFDVPVSAVRDAVNFEKSLLAA